MATLERVVHAVQLITAVATAAFVILLFTNEPQKPAPVPKQGADVGQAIFATRCASCHGADGGGGFGPTLAGVVAATFPERGRPGSRRHERAGLDAIVRDSLTPEQIEAVVEYTRTRLG